ncbi:hypothetical protein E1B28_003870 [Marasmius oreades]|uniref:Uncharacterized protein n=1 Tax=Marasmius oreades TaxID=181124 RepID=A0A9P8AC31_9AGAR|nr:uncharacterized protein E1B28_003870 [Marasmius oreades]KAG7096433.1 hypothetical protein E1B28_003870 [Marasmius oreades]
MSSRRRNHTPNHSYGHSSTSTAPYSRLTPRPGNGPTTITLTVSPTAIATWRRRLELAKQQGDQRQIQRFERNIQYAERPQERILNYIGMPYTPGVHGPARRIALDLDGFDLDFVYWDSRLMGEKVVFSCTVMPHDLPPTATYDWREHNVKVFAIHFLDREEEVTSDYLMTAMAGQRMLVKVPMRDSTTNYVSRLVILQPAVASLSEPRIARY